MERRDEWRHRGVAAGFCGDSAVIRDNGAVLAWGAERFGNSAPLAATLPFSPVVSLHATGRAFVALHADGTTTPWGYEDAGGYRPPSSDSDGGVTSITPSSSAFAATYEDGHVFAWGGPVGGGVYNAPNSLTSPVAGAWAVSNGIAANYDSFAALVTYWPCPEGNRAELPANLSATLAPGFHWSEVCNPCAAGTAQPLEAQYTCVDCPAGSYQDLPGQVVCKTCPAGTFQTLPGQVGCVPCTRAHAVLNQRSLPLDGARSFAKLPSLDLPRLWQATLAATSRILASRPLPPALLARRGSTAI